SPDEVLLERFKVVSKIGEIGMGVTYKGLDLERGAQVTLTVLSPKFVTNPKRFRRIEQAVATARPLVHRNIVQMYGLFQGREHTFIVKEFVDGVSLKKAVERFRGRGKRFPVVQIERIVQEICRGLDYAHHHTVHKNLRPENVLLASEGAKIANFGFAALALSPRTMNGFIAPEVRRNPSQAGTQADVYAVAALFYFMFTGEIPPLDLYERLEPAKLPPGIYPLLREALAPDPRERMRSALEFGVQLKHELREGTSKEFSVVEIRGSSGTYSSPPLRLSPPIPQEQTRIHRGPELEVVPEEEKTRIHLPRQKGGEDGASHSRSRPLPSAERPMNPSPEEQTRIHRGIGESNETAEEETRIHAIRDPQASVLYTEEQTHLYRPAQPREEDEPPTHIAPKRSGKREAERESVIPGATEAKTRIAAPPGRGEEEASEAEAGEVVEASPYVDLGPPPRRGRLTMRLAGATLFLAIVAGGAAYLYHARIPPAVHERVDASPPPVVEPISLQDYESSPTLPEIEANSRAIAALRKRADARFEAGIITEAPGEDAVSLYREILERDPNDPHAQTQLRAIERELLAEGDAAYAQGDYETARKHYESVLYVNPDNEEARGQIEAIESTRHAMASAPSSAPEAKRPSPPPARKATPVARANPSPLPVVPPPTPRLSESSVQQRPAANDRVREATEPQPVPFSKKSITEVVERNMRGLQFCIQIGGAPDVSGKQVEVRFIITERGEVEKAEIASSTVHNRRIESCILRRIERWRFPPPPEPVRVKYPFIFE
ncbi:MAG: TonB family protein, partial [Deltaproteobacteria bacterium]